MPERLNLDVVLVTPKIGHCNRIGRRFLPQQGRNQRTHLIGDIAPVLHPVRPPVGARPGGDITQRPHMRSTGGAHRVTHHAVVHHHARPVQPIDRGAAPDTQDDQVGVQARPIRQGDGLDPVLPFHGVHADAHPNVHTLVAVQPGHQVPELLADSRQQRRRLRLHQDHLNSVGPQGGRHLAADETCPDDDRPPRVLGVATQREAVVGRAQYMNTSQVWESRNATGHQTGRDDHLSVLQGAAVTQGDRAGHRVQRGDLGAETQLNLLLVVKLSRFEHHRVDRLLRVTQDILGERRPVVRQMGLTTDDGDWPGELRTAQLFGGSYRAQPTTDDQHSTFRVGHGFLHTRLDTRDVSPITPAPAPGPPGWKAPRCSRCGRYPRWRGCVPVPVPGAGYRVPRP
ncbi:Uncharacterised protein [Mycobacteroides abscessus subsp. massiliense]|nr:Uncharacterised protein [Mycobacteroides abscessus subsp. massiliense]